MQDAVLAAVFTVLGFLPPLAANGVQLGQLPGHRAGPLAVVLALAQCLPLVIRRRWPTLCLAIVACAFAAYQLLGYRSSFASVGLLLALYAAVVGVLAVRRLAFGLCGLVVFAAIGLAAALTRPEATASYVVLAIALQGLGSPERPVGYVLFYLAMSACWGLGAYLQARRADGAEPGRS